MVSREKLLYPYQQRWLADNSRFKAGMFSRQSGKTFTCTFEIATDCVKAERAGNPTRWVILSRGERQAKEAMETGLKLHLRALRAAFEAHEIEHLLDDGRTKVSGVEITLPRGSRVTALPAAPDTARGFTANLMLDEFAFHADSRKIWAAAFPVISRGRRKVRVISTPNGKGNKFHEIMTDNDPDCPWSRHVVDIHQAVSDGLPQDVDELKRGLRDPDAWAAEYELEWLDEALAWLPYDLLASIEHDSASQTGEGFTEGATYIGNDIAARKDLWVAWVWERVGDVLWTREVRVLRRASFAEQAATLAELVERYRPVRIAMDQTGMGEAPTEEAKRRYGEYRVEGVLFTGPSKQHMATLLKQQAEDRRLRIPIDTDIRNDLHSLRRITTPAGNVRFDVDGGDGHADRAWAAALGVYAADTPAEVFDYRPVRTRYEPNRERGIRASHAEDRDHRRVRATGGFVRGVL